MRGIVITSALLAIFGVASPTIAQDPKQLQVISNHGGPKLPLTDALRVIGLHLKGGFVSFGVDISGDTEPEVSIELPDTNLGDALRRITSQIPGYTSEFVSEHVVEVYSAKERANVESPLNLPIREFSVKDVPATQILSMPTRYMPELKDYLSKGRKENNAQAGQGCGSLGPGLGSNAAGVTLFLAGRTLRQILDAVAEADASLPISSSPPHFRLYPSGWVHKRRLDAKLGLVDTWSSMSFAPHDWELYAAK
jgi:hypothetical protein